MFIPTITSIKTLIRRISGGATLPTQSKVVVYVRDKKGQNYYFPSLQEGIMHLLSNEGQRLNVWAGDNADPSTGSDQRWGLKVWRHNDNQLTIQVDAPFLKHNVDDSVEYDFEELLSSVRFHNRNKWMEPLEKAEMVEVTIDGH